VYKENHPKAFYDSMDFWNDQEGIAIGDPTDDCMSIIITRDGGNTWNKLSCNELPKAKEGEAAFAASDTNIAIVGDNTWVATGGKASRVLFSPDKGKTWKVYDTPIIQGTETTGMYSIDFYDELNGFAIGGDYTKPNDNAANKIRTKDGGKTWQVVAKGENPGYRSCVQYIPNREGKELVTIGFKGIDYSYDEGYNWNHLSDEGFYTIRFLNDSIAYAAGKGRISKLTFRE
ncbi:MAG: oxidoreductase, partial [Bacteroidetes bacterium]|nr:oxidoreductase [Bacteroidota bacterium]